MEERRRKFYIDITTGEIDTKSKLNEHYDEDSVFPPSNKDKISLFLGRDVGTDATTEDNDYDPGLIIQQVGIKDITNSNLGKSELSKTILNILFQGDNFTDEELNTAIEDIVSHSAEKILTPLVLKKIEKIGYNWLVEYIPFGLVSAIKYSALSKPINK